MPVKESKKINESYYLPDPKGAKDTFTVKAYHKEINDIVTNAIEEARKKALETIVDKIKTDLTDKLISISDEKGKQKIIYVNDVVVEKSAKDKENSIYLVEKYEDDGGKTQERKIKFSYEKPPSTGIFNVGNFLDFFEANYIDKYIQFSGKPVAGGTESTFRKTIKQIGISNDATQDYILVECDDKTMLFLFHDKPIRLVDPALKELDPFAEEDWDN